MLATNGLSLFETQPLQGQRKKRAKLETPTPPSKSESLQIPFVSVSETSLLKPFQTSEKLDLENSINQSQISSPPPTLVTPSKISIRPDTPLSEEKESEGILIL